MPAQTVSSDVVNNEGTTSPRSASLPITRDLTLAYALSLVIAFLMTVAAVAGLLFQTEVYQTDNELLFGVPTDVVSLVVGLPNSTPIHRSTFPLSS